ncbi:hypothetical protein SSX86_015062 [Deinandra increscens subsp. villosa]|uniref:Uncharacterized protein n=1 Tax=Deinandra increscens subsp. villosa TaxID=3103831 RepID=A0AAP0D0S5_9ASTR
MDSGSQAAVDGGGGRSGGKILKRRPIAARKTPYDRPTPPPQPENSNWRNGLLFPAKFVAGGATKLLSSIWNPKSWASHSSSSDSDSDSEVGIEDGLVRDESLPDGDPELNQNKGSSSGKGEILYLIEQLIMLEHFSREECDRLIEIVNSRVVDYTMNAGVDDAPKKPDISNKAIMEARKIISENMAGTSSKSDLDNNIHGSKSFMTPDRDYLSGGSLVAPKPGNETANLASNGWFFASYMKNTQDDVPTGAVLSLPTIEEQNQIAEEKDDKTGDDVNLVEGNHDLITDHTEVVDLINVSQGSSNTSDPPSSTKAANSPSANHRPVTRSRKYNTRRGRARGK